jgi:hypothetical protein
MDIAKDMMKWRIVPPRRGILMELVWVKVTEGKMSVMK